MNNMRNLCVCLLLSAAFVQSGCDRPMKVVERTPLAVVHSRPLMNGWRMLVDTNRNLSVNAYESSFIRGAFALAIGDVVHLFTEKSDGLYSDHGWRVLSFDVNAVTSFNRFPPYPSFEYRSVRLIDMDTMQCSERKCRVFTYFADNIISGYVEVIVYVESIGIVAMIGNSRSIVMLDGDEEMSPYLLAWVRLHDRDPIIRNELGYYQWEKW